MPGLILWPESCEARHARRRFSPLLHNQRRMPRCPPQPLPKL